MSGADPLPANEVRSGQVKGQRKGQVISNRKRNQLGRYCVVPSWRLLLSSNPPPPPPIPPQMEASEGGAILPPLPSSRAAEGESEEQRGFVAMATAGDEGSHF